MIPGKSSGNPQWVGEGGVLLVDKPAGLTSARVVAKVKKHFAFKKVGHAGTLDPFATGLLVLLHGKATKLQSQFLESDKEYEGTIRVGLGTSTDDITGEVLSEDGELAFAKEESLDVLATRLSKRFSGKQEQVPPQISAIHVNGVRSYKRARRGEVVTLAPREVTVYDLKLTFETPASLRYKLKCSKGTYVRALARDIGVFLGTGACVESLRRTASGELRVEDAVVLDKLLGAEEEESFSNAKILRI